MHVTLEFVQKQPETLSIHYPTTLMSESRPKAVHS